MNKIRVMMIPSDPYGVGHYRNFWPAKMIQKNHSDEFQVDVRFREAITEDDLKNYDIIHYHRSIPAEDPLKIVNQFKNAGVITVCDIDDYWVPPYGHPIRELAIKKGLPKQITDNLKMADYVTTTTDIFKKRICALDKNIKVKVLPNGIDHNVEMWQLKREPSDKVRIGWVGGSSHEKDLSKLHGTFNKLFSDKELEGKFQIIMCGYDTRGTITEVGPDGKERTRKIRPEESIWNKFEAIFNNNGNHFKDGYVRRNTLPINQYGKHYNYIDVCLAPLVENIFNECKSELKLIETGMMKSALIASDIHIYGEMLEHGKTGLLIPAKKDHKLWYKYIKELILNEELRTSLQNNLHDLVDPAYRLDVLTEDRCNWYKEILNGQ